MDDASLCVICVMLGAFGSILPGSKRADVMGRHQKTTELIEAAVEILAAHHPQTVHQVFYQLVSRQVIENSPGPYQSVSKALVAARQDGTIPWEQIEDRLRRARHVSKWEGLGDFATSASGAYAAGTPFFFKQDAVHGKKLSLRELDGRVWRAFPIALRRPGDA